MKLKIQAGSIGNQTIIDSVENGDVIISKNQIANLTDDDRISLTSALVEQIAHEIEVVDNQTLSEAKKNALKARAKEILATEEGDPEKQRISVANFLKMLNESMGDLSGVFSKSIQLVQLFGIK